MEGLKLTPMMQQYLEIKQRHRDSILLFRLGDFYEMFFEDAQTAAKILDIALTSRHRSEDGSVPLCGVPYHSAEPYIQKLLRAGHKVAVCEQIEDPKVSKGVVERDVVRVITPGTVTAEEALDARANNFLAAVRRGRKGFGLALTDITTGAFRCARFAEERLLIDEISRVNPRELLIAAGEQRFSETLKQKLAGIFLSPVAEENFTTAARERIKPGTGCDEKEWDDALRAASAVLNYLEGNIPDALKVLHDLELYEASNYLVLDETTRANLELVAGYDGQRKGSLLAVLDRTRTAMGARLLRQWLLYPLLDEHAIRARLDAVEEFVENFSLREQLKSGLDQVQDLERLAGRAASGSALPRDLTAIKLTLQAVGQLRADLASVDADALLCLRETLSDLPMLADVIGRAIIDNPPAALKGGGFIRAGFDAELDEVRGIRAHAKDWVANFETAERRRTGIASLKVRYNRVFGYYIEITKANLKAVPAEYIRKQTLVNVERYITPELKEYEAKVLNSQEVIERLEAQILARVREQVALHYGALTETGRALALLDAIISLAEVAESQHFVRPRVDPGTAIVIRDGRHPVVEASMGRGAFVPNDTILDPSSNQILLLTGPNMAGKSTYMRQVALIVIMAQIGSFVPAAEARIGAVDRIFTRIGAADSLTRGESTFMVEMKETAALLRYATSRSLILLDEVGRGTSTYDGVSIAWAVAEHLHDSAEHPKTLFATHYHELTELTQSRERIKNYNFAVKEWQGEIIFLRNLVRGAASRSYGIHVARLAGLPETVITRAKEILSTLESQDNPRERPRPPAEPEEPIQMGLFNSRERKLQEELARLDLSQMTPLAALNLLHKWSEEIKK
ncbi:MAG TPA: DNA mismatch repair protein MutS [Candidatus Binatia bacterium]|nr:DNA mismatch repair protein MutS [Candidatus Binatia bacterium]